MPILRTVFAVALVVLPAPSLARSLPKDYAGPDGGFLVYSVGDVKGAGLDYSFNYHRVSLPNGAPANDFKSVIEPYLGGAMYLKVKNPDFGGEETGHVIVRRLPPGQYVVDNFLFAGATPTMGYIWKSAVPFLLPFTISPGGATYIGSFMRGVSLGTPLAAKLGAAGYFVIANRAARDLPIATRKATGLPPVTAQVTDVDTFGSAALRSSEP